jgi:hypothetical protein
MCVIFGYIKKCATEENIEGFLQSSYSKALPTNKKLSVAFKTAPIYDYFTLDNEAESKAYLSKLKSHEALFCILNDKTCPLEMEGNLFALDGKFNTKKIDQLKEKYGNIDCNLDYAYVFKDLKEDFIQWHNFDDEESNFAGWWLHTNSILVQFFSKKQPLFFKYTKEVIYFSSFQEDADFKPLENCVKVINIETYQEKAYYKFKNGVGDK